MGIEFDVAKDGLIGAEQYTKKSANGLMQVTVRFGMTRLPLGPTGEADVKAAFADVVAALHEFADGIGKVNNEAPTFTKPAACASAHLSVTLPNGNAHDNEGGPNG